MVNMLKKGIIEIVGRMGKEKSEVMEIFGEIPSLETNRLWIHRPGEKDAYWVGAMRSDEKVYRYLPGFLVELKFQDKLGAIEYVESYQVEVLGIYRKESPDEMIGLVEIYDYDPERRIASVGYRYRSTCWGKGYATEALQEILAFLWQFVDIVTAHVMVENAPSRKVLMKNGFHAGRQHFLEDWDRGEPVYVDELICRKKSADVIM